MNFDQHDFIRIRASLFAALAAGIAAGGIAWITDRWHDSAIKARATAAAQLGEFEGKLRQVRSEEAEIKHKAAVFDKLRERGIIGEESRLDWVELIKEIRDSRKLLEIQYEFLPQQSMEKEGSGDYAFRSSTMRLQMKLLHEGDLLQFINDLRSRARAYIRVRSCTLSRIPRGTLGAGDPALLGAVCEIDWITVLPVKGAG